MTTRSTTVRLVPALALALVLAGPRALAPTWEVKLRPNIKFHNGQARDAEAVKFSLTRALDPAVKSAFASSLNTIARVEAVGPGLAPRPAVAPAPGGRGPPWRRLRGGQGPSVGDYVMGSGVPWGARAAGGGLMSPTLPILLTARGGKDFRRGPTT